MKKDGCVIFTDGSARGNPGPAGWGAIIFADGKVREIGGASPKATNNQMELAAAIEALRACKEEKNINVYSDSSYVLNGITSWVNGWQKNGWMTASKKPVENKELWQELVSVSADKEITWCKVEGHAGVPGNERCDEIATAFADGREHNLFAGRMEDYGVDIFTVEATAQKEARSSSQKKSSAKAYSYISKVNGVVYTDKTWAQCLSRVSGVSGARFKKALSKSEEDRIIREFS